MAYADELAEVRDNLIGELKAETARRKAIVQAGHPAPTTYTVKGRQQDWNGYLTAALGQIRDLNEQVLAAGGDGGVIDEAIRGYV